MEAFLLVPILVSGFWICHCHPKYRLRLHRFHDQYIYLLVLQHGTVTGIFALSALLIMHAVLPDTFSIRSVDFSLSLAPTLQRGLMALLQAKTDDAGLYRQLAWGVLWSLTTVFASIAWSSLIRRRYRYRGTVAGYDNIKKLAIIRKLLRDSPLDKLFFDAFVSRDPICITLDNDKVYVGIVTMLGEPTENEAPNQEIEIVPLLSGYRTEQGCPVFTTNYSAGGARPPKLATIIPQKNIVVASWFDIQFYLDTQPHCDIPGEQAEGA